MRDGLGIYLSVCSSRLRSIYNFEDFRRKKHMSRVFFLRGNNDACYFCIMISLLSSLKLSSGRIGIVGGAIVARNFDV